MSDWFTAKCDFCGKTYNCSHAKIFIQHGDDESSRKCCCLECRDKEEKKPYWFENHVPDFCDGAKKIVRLFDSKEQLLQWLYKEFEDEDYKIGMNSISKSHAAIISVRKSEKFWWVEGWTDLESGSFPDWRDIVVKYHGEV